MKKTSVEWLAETLKFSNKEIYAQTYYIIEQAKEMEKQQIIDIWIDAYTTNMKAATRDNFIMWANNYYNETFNTNEK